MSLSGLPPTLPSGVLAETRGRELAKEKRRFYSFNPNTTNRMRREGCWLRDDGSIISTQRSSHDQTPRSGDAPAHWPPSSLESSARPMYRELLVERLKGY